MSTNGPELKTTTEAARHFEVSPRTLLRWLRAGLLPGVQTAGGHWRVDPADLEVFFGRQRGATTVAPRSAGLRIVIVEDDAQHAVALVRLLRLLEPSAIIRQAADGLSAGLLIGTVVPDVAFVDIELPAFDGLELIRRAREQPALGQVRFAVVSGHLSAQRIAELDRLGVRHIVPKPINPEQIRQVLDEVLAEAAASRAKPKHRLKETHASHAHAEPARG